MSLSLETRANDQDTAVEMRWLHDSEDEALTQKDVDDAAALTRHVAVEGSARALLERVQKDAAKRFQRRTAGVTLLIGAVLVLGVVLLEAFTALRIGPDWPMMLVGIAMTSVVIGLLLSSDQSSSRAAEITGTTFHNEALFERLDDEGRRALLSVRDDDHEVKPGRRELMIYGVAGRLGIHLDWPQ